MRSERWWQSTSVTENLFQTPKKFEFIQAIRLLRHVPFRLNQRRWASHFYFGTSLELGFPATEIEHLAQENDRIELVNLIVGLTGTQGALPYTYTNKVKRSARPQRKETQAFLGLFNHTLSAQYVDASLVHHLPLRYEIEEENHYLKILHALNGYIAEQHQQPELDEYFAEFAGLMQGQNHTAYALSTMLRCIFKQQVKVQEFIREKFALNDAQKTSLGGQNPSLLGVNTFCGDQVEQMDGKIEIQIGPLQRQDYLRFLPSGVHSQRLKQILQTWSNPTLLVDVRLILKHEDVQPFQLSSVHEQGLGQGAFLMSAASGQDRDDTCYALIGVVA
ncbi:MULTISPECIES: type VI secretion system baseplate subunit TssG [Acinetobacter]|uniref:type VI secretion system baseplate subunit TssG n=1 Tax=Acinetobacter TaxID=469 RepID=UPI00124C98F4|nr:MULTISPECIES: type VI secretion system baseplate subunit TssG [Acinetobacter]MDI3377212.1 type VI secretion system baseplate subunit TssG [Acinetobacter sp. V89_7]